LTGVTALAAQELKLLLGLDAFGHDRHRRVACRS
jgi:hypothetical protein